GVGSKEKTLLFMYTQVHPDLFPTPHPTPYPLHPDLFPTPYPLHPTPLFLTLFSKLERNNQPLRILPEPY
ncbi:hypothetical protein, partial [Nostoc sp. WHI]|uniref:hypothetical protein n=1 Tax=Nostoc sp. WHI TaxID=2650611 RepID=UPI001E499863